MYFSMREEGIQISMIKSMAACRTCQNTEMR